MRWKIMALLCAAGMTALGAQAQFGRERASPHETTRAVIDGAALSITYGRPYMKGRKIMGGLVPYGRVWCPGADEATKLTTSKALKLGELAVPAGSYSLWMLPTADEWTLILNKQGDLFHLRRPEQDDLGKVKLEKRSLKAPVEQLTFSIENNPAGGGIIRMQWETTDVSVPFVVQ
jgi:hypothetical protein